MPSRLTLMRMSSTERLEEYDEAQEDVAWHRGLLFRARKSLGDADLKNLWALPEPPDDALILAVKRAAEAWSQTAQYLESNSRLDPEGIGREPEQLRQVTPTSGRCPAAQRSADCECRSRTKLRRSLER